MPSRRARSVRWCALSPQARQPQFWPHRLVHAPARPGHAGLHGRLRACRIRWPASALLARAGAGTIERANWPLPPRCVMIAARPPAPQASFESEENQMHLVLWSPERASSAGVASAVAPAARPAADAVASEAAEGDVDLDSAVASALSWASGRRENSRGTPAAGRGGAAPAAGTGSSRSRSGSGGGGGGSGSGGSGSGGSGSSGSRAKRGARTPEAAPADAAPATAAVAAAGSPAADSTFLAKLVGILPHMVSLVSWLAANRAAPAVSKAR